MKLTTHQLAVIAVVVLVALWYFKKQIASALDITSGDNLAHQAVTNVGSALTGRENFSPGVWLWEQFNGDALDAETEGLE